MDQPPQADEFSQPPLRPEVVPEPAPAPPPRKSRLLSRLIWGFLLLGLVGSVVMNLLLFAAVGLTGLGLAGKEGRVQEKYFSQNRHGSHKVAILSIEGTILGGEGSSFFKHQIDHAKKDAEEGNLKAIVVRINSPGGSISGSDYMLHYLRELVEESEIPLVVSMGGVAASGGYYVSMCVGDAPQTIFAEPSTWTGSIGVIIPHYNFAELMKNWGVQEDAIASGPLKTMGSFARPMTPQEKKIFQSLVNDGFAQFKDAIKRGRPEFRDDPATLDKLATGQIFSAQQALENGLIDKIGFIEDAIDRAINLAGLDKKNVKVVKYEAAPRLADILFGQSRARSSYDLATLLETTTPRAYYLCTWLPALAGSAKLP